jgi:hypothetical protein
MNGARRRQWGPPIVGLGLLGLLLSACGEDESVPTQSSDTTAPAAVNDLEVVPDFGASDGIVRWRLVWTSAGDDLMRGTPSAVILRYSNAAIEEANWEAAAVLTVLNEPAPGGASQSLLLEPGFNVGTWFFALRSVDEAGNQAALSNVAPHAAGPTSLDRMVSSLIESYRRRDVGGFDALLKDDFVFQFAPEDVVLSPNGSGIWDRFAELAVTSRIFSGSPGSTLAPVEGIAIVLTPLDAQWSDASDAAYAGTRQRRYQVLMDLTHASGASSRVTGVQRFHVAQEARQILGFSQDLWTLRHWIDFGKHQPRELQGAETVSWGAFKATF